MQLVRISDKKPYATIAFYETAKGVFESPHRGTFGGVTLDEEIGLSLLEDFIIISINHLKSSGAKSIFFKNAG